MITIQTSPLRRSLPLAVMASLALGLVLGTAVARIADVGEWWLLVAGGFALLGYLGLEVLVGALYRSFAFDPVTRTARIGRRTVAIDSIAEAWRSVSAGGNGAAYLVYRFRSSEGPVVRVLVAGRPMAGLDEKGRAALAAFLELAPIPAPAGTRTDDLASNVVADGKKVPVGAAALLAELGAATGTASPSEAPAPVVDPAEAALLQADEAAAAEALGPTARLGAARRTAGVVLAIGLAATGLGAVGVIVASAVGVDVDQPGTGVGVRVVLGVVVVGGLAWSILADLHVRAVRAAGRRWLDTADDATRARGLPTVFAGAWLQFAPGHRILTLAAFSAAVVGVGGVIGGPVVMAEGWVGIGIALLLAGLGLCALGLWFWVRHQRRRRADVAWAIEALGPRAR